MIDIYETVSVCCNAETIQAFNMRTKSVRPACVKCNTFCQIAEVCAYCHGTGEVVGDEEDGEGHTNRGVLINKCRCQYKEPFEE